MAVVPGEGLQAPGIGSCAKPHQVFGYHTQPSQEYQYVIQSNLDWQVKRSIPYQMHKPNQKKRTKWLYFLFRKVRQIDESVDNKRVYKMRNFNPE
jgi:hypothetical protein